MNVHYIILSANLIKLVFGIISNSVIFDREKTSYLQQNIIKWTKIKWTTLSSYNYRHVP